MHISTNAARASAIIILTAAMVMPALVYAAEVNVIADVDVEANVGENANADGNYDANAALLENASRMVLDIYLNEDAISRALLTGYLDDPSILVLPEDSQLSYDNQTGQIFILTGGLVESDGPERTIELEARGNLDRLQMSFFLPPGAELAGIQTSEGLLYLISEENEAPLVQVQGFQVDDPAVSIVYRENQ